MSSPHELLDDLLWTVHCNDISREDLLAQLASDEAALRADLLVFASDVGELAQVTAIFSELDTAGLRVFLERVPSLAVELADDLVEEQPKQIGRSAPRGKRGEKRPRRVQGWLTEVDNERFGVICQERKMSRSGATQEAIDDWICTWELESDLE